jgi:hypothetical protein
MEMRRGRRRKDAEGQDGVGGREGKIEVKLELLPRKGRGKMEEGEEEEEGYGGGGRARREGRKTRE